MPNIHDSNNLRDHALVASAAEKLAKAKSNLEAGRTALTQAVADRTAASAAHRAAILNAAPGSADSKGSTEAHQHAVSAVALAESLVADLEHELSREEENYAHAVAQSWAPVQAKGKELRLAAVRAGERARAAMQEAAELYTEGTSLIDRSFAGGMPRPRGGIPGLILEFPGRPPRLPTEAEEISNLATLGGAA